MILSILLFPFYYIHVGYPFENNPREVLEDLPDAITQMINNKLILVSLLGKENIIINLINYYFVMTLKICRNDD